MVGIIVASAGRTATREKIEIASICDIKVCLEASAKLHKDVSESGWRKRDYVRCVYDKRKERTNVDTKMGFRPSYSWLWRQGS